MSTGLIRNTSRWRITSYGNGLAYLIEARTFPRQRAYLEGVDAIEWRNGWDQAEADEPQTPTDDMLDRLWDGIETIAEAPP